MYTLPLLFDEYANASLILQLAYEIWHQMQAPLRWIEKSKFVAKLIGQFCPCYALGFG